MATVSGKLGSISFTGITVGVRSWTLNQTSTALPASTFATAALGYKGTITSGVYGWTATAEGNWDTANTAVPGDSASLVLTSYTACTYTGTAVLTGMSINTDAEGVVTASYSFEGTGSLTVA